MIFITVNGPCNYSFILYHIIAAGFLGTSMLNMPLFQQYSDMLVDGVKRHIEPS